ncbi:TPA: exodeoxyribonuclease VIII, partial [Shigella sonnei]|nr:exodeoxyribonuclease VIII [Shigella sonnei]
MRQTEDKQHQNSEPEEGTPCNQTGEDNCPDCGAVMGDATYQETFDEKKPDEAQEEEPKKTEKADDLLPENAGSDQHNDSNNETGEDELNWKRQVLIAAVYGLCANPAC